MRMPFVKISKRRQMSRVIIGASYSILFLFGIINAQSSYNLYVTYYDFHENGTNPDFGVLYKPGCNDFTAMTTLDSQKKPVPTCLGGVYLEKWFRPWTPGDTLQVTLAADTIFGTTPSGRRLDTAMTALLGDSMWIDTYDTTFIAAGIVRSDTLFKNVVAVDSIQMDQQGITDYYSLLHSGILKNRDGNPDSIIWFPLDGKGFEALGYPRMPNNPSKHRINTNEHNDGFTMELHSRFIYKGGEKIYISGSSNKWIFINNTRTYERKVDGTPSIIDTIILDSLNLTINDTVDFDLFDAENGLNDIEFGFTTNIAFLAQTKPVVGTINNRNALSRGSSKIIFLGKGALIRVPVQTQKMDLSVCNASGKIVSRGDIAHVGKSVENLPAGMFFVKVNCLDRNGHSLGNVVNRIVLTKYTQSRASVR